MNAKNKRAVRAAVLIHAQLAESRQQALSLYLPTYSWDNLQKLQRQISRACHHGWQLAARRLTDDLADTLEECRRQMENAHRQLQSLTAEKHHHLSAADIYQDILALYDEFEEVEIDLKEQVLSVTTDRIVLEEVDLGPFKIRFEWRQLGSHQPYCIVALEPNPAAKSDEITHPHVQEERLCEGDGRLAIQAALAECRLHDFFMLVSQLLHTYGRGSGYVELADWKGIPCEDCGDSVIEDERYCCERCGATLCSDCSVSCQGCDEYFCSSCLSACTACGLEYCSGCLASCHACRKPFCADCLEGGLCLKCQEKQHHEEEKDDPSEDVTSEPVTAGA